MSQVTQGVLAPDHPEGDDGGLDDVGGESHDGVHPQALSVLAQVRSTNPLNISWRSSSGLHP